jgi:hypothetical protein
VRLVVSDDGIAVDRSRRLPGRGAYLCPDRRCLRQALKRRALPRRLRAVGLEERLDLEDEPGVWES